LLCVFQQVKDSCFTAEERGGERGGRERRVGGGGRGREHFSVKTLVPQQRHRQSKETAEQKKQRAQIIFNEFRLGRVRPIKSTVLRSYWYFWPETDVTFSRAFWFAISCSILWRFG